MAMGFTVLEQRERRTWTWRALRECVGCRVPDDLGMPLMASKNPAEMELAKQTKLLRLCTPQAQLNALTGNASNIQFYTCKTLTLRGDAIYFGRLRS